jgi:hypothetical protein
MPEWEYTTVSLNDRAYKTRPVDVLSDAGQVGWELVIITPNQVAYLKRQVAQRRARPAPSTAAVSK